jgi:hypothetical protein
MSALPASVRMKTDALDAAGNTTAAIGKGFAIGSACLTSLALFGAFVTRVQNKSLVEGAGGAPTYKAGPLNVGVDILQPITFASLIVGAMIPYWFSALTMKSVGLAAMEMVNVRTGGLVHGRNSTPSCVPMAAMDPFRPGPAGSAVGAIVYLFRCASNCFSLRSAGGGPAVPRDPGPAGGHPGPRQARPRVLHQDFHGRVPAGDDPSGCPGYLFPHRVRHSVWCQLRVRPDCGLHRVFRAGEGRAVVGPVALLFRMPALCEEVSVCMAAHTHRKVLTCCPCLCTACVLCLVQLAISMSNTGGAWDNAKKYVERGSLTFKVDGVDVVQRKGRCVGVGSTHICTECPSTCGRLCGFEGCLTLCSLPFLLACAATRTRPPWWATLWVTR